MPSDAQSLPSSPAPAVTLPGSGAGAVAGVAEHPPVSPRADLPCHVLDDRALDTLFRTARSHNAWADHPVADAKLEQLYDLLKFGPTSANSSPARFVFVRTAEGKAKLKPALSPGNLAKTMTAPVVAIVAHDLRFYDELPRLFPHADARGWFAGNDALATETAFRNATLQGAYLVLAARAVGLDAGPMSGFDKSKVDAAFFAGTTLRSNFLVNLGHGDPAALYARSPRLSFDEACTLA